MNKQWENSVPLQAQILGAQEHTEEASNPVLEVTEVFKDREEDSRKKMEGKKKKKKNEYLPFSYFCFLGPQAQHMEVPRHPRHMEIPRLVAEVELHLPAYNHSQSSTGSKQRLPPTPQLKATQDPYPTEQGKGSNWNPHGS